MGEQGKVTWPQVWKLFLDTGGLTVTKAMVIRGVYLGDYDYMSCPDNNYENARRVLHVVEDGQMPPGGPRYTADQLGLLKKWMSDGYLQGTAQEFEKVSGIRTRRNILELDQYPEELQAYRDALQSLYDQKEQPIKVPDDSHISYIPDINAFQNYVEWHGEQRLTCNHGTILFLPWHRVYILALEDLLRRQPTKNAEIVTLPYWDWTTYDIPKIYTDETYIKDGKEVPNPLHSSFMKLPPSVLPEYRPSQHFDHMIIPNRPDPDTPTAVQQLHTMMEAAMKRDSFWQDAPNGSENNGFSAMLELPHANVHDWSGFDMRNQTELSAFCPLFLAHHSNCDRHWWEWQQMPQGLGKTEAVAKQMDDEQSYARPNQEMLWQLWGKAGYGDKASYLSDIRKVNYLYTKPSYYKNTYFGFYGPHSPQVIPFPAGTEPLTLESNGVKPPTNEHPLISHLLPKKVLVHLPAVKQTKHNHTLRIDVSDRNGADEKYVASVTLAGQGRLLEFAKAGAPKCCSAHWCKSHEFKVIDISRTLANYGMLDEIRVPQDLELHLTIIESSGKEVPPNSILKAKPYLQVINN